MFTTMVVSLFILEHITCVETLDITTSMKMTIHSDGTDKAEQTIPSFNVSKQLNRQRRAPLTNYYIDVAAIVDYKIYSAFLNESGYSSTETVKKINEHYAFVFAEVNTIFQGISEVNYRINIRLCKVYITQTRSASRFIDDLTTNDRLDGKAALSALKDFIVGVGRSIVGAYDHVMLFTGYDVKDLGDSKYISATPHGSMCNTDGSSVSVMEDQASYFNALSVAQLLAYSLSAKNDGDTNGCNPSDRYIIGALNSDTTVYNKFNPWKFSPCSIDSFNNFLRNKVETSRGYICLGFFLDVSSDIPDVSGRLLGQEFTPDQQCRKLYGSNSYYRRYTDVATLSDICNAMGCQDPTNEGRYYRQAALIGTSCGDGKICINGQCVNDQFAPQVDEKCIFGDQPGNVGQSMTCSQEIATSNALCYNNKKYHLCCSSCNKVYQPIQGCEYGDNATDCQPTYCPQYQTQCCKTCNYGTPFTPATTTKRTTPLRTTSQLVPWPTITSCKSGDPDLIPGICTSPNVCQTQRTFCCSYCSMNSSATVPGSVVLVHLALYILVLFTC